MGKIFIPTCFASLMEIGSIFYLIKAYYCRKEKCLRKRIMPLIFTCILDVKKDHTFQFLLALINTNVFSETQLALNSAQFNTVPEHDS